MAGCYSWHKRTRGRWRIRCVDTPRKGSEPTTPHPGKQEQLAVSVGNATSEMQKKGFGSIWRSPSWILGTNPHRWEERLNRCHLKDTSKPAATEFITMWWSSPKSCLGAVSRERVPNHMLTGRTCGLVRANTWDVADRPTSPK